MSNHRLLRRLRLQLKCWSGDVRNVLRHGWGAPRVDQRLFVDPAEIRQATAGWRFDRTASGDVVGGDWDLDLVPVERLAKIDLVSRRMRENLSWDEAGLYRLMMRLIGKSRSGAYDGCRTLDDVVLRYDRVDALIAHLRAGGAFLEGRALGRVREQGGVLVHIGREGQYIFGRTGCHRLAVARGLGLPAMPVLLGVVHAGALHSGAFKRVLARSRSLRQAMKAGESRLRPAGTFQRE
jgi:hypothetical protein